MRSLPPITSHSIGREKLTKKRKPSWKSNKQVSLTKPAAPFWRAVESVEARRKKRRIDFFENVLGVAVNIKRPRTDQREREADVADGLLIRKNVVRWELVKVIHSKQSCEGNVSGNTGSDVICIPTMTSYVLHQWRHTVSGNVSYPTLLFRIKGTQSETQCIPLWTPLAQNYYLANSMKSWDPTRNLLHLANDLGDSK